MCTDKIGGNEGYHVYVHAVYLLDFEILKKICILDEVSKHA